KTQLIRPIFKKGKKDDPDNYRPIFILPAINKICEKYFADKITDFVLKTKGLSKQQFGFQRGKSTLDALKYINEEITEALNNNKFVNIIFIDLQKAFDSINRSL